MDLTLWFGLEGLEQGSYSGHSFMHLRFVGVLSTTEPQPSATRMECIFGGPGSVLEHSSVRMKGRCSLRELPGAQTWVRQILKHCFSFPLIRNLATPIMSDPCPLCGVPSGADP